MERQDVLLSDVVIKFAGDSGDGMQLTGTQFTNNTAMLGIDLATFPDFPAEIRAAHIGRWPERIKENREAYAGHHEDDLIVLRRPYTGCNIKPGKSAP